MVFAMPDPGRLDAVFFFEAPAEQLEGAEMEFGDGLDFPFANVVFDIEDEQATGFDDASHFGPGSSVEDPVLFAPLQGTG